MEDPVFETSELPDPNKKLVIFDLNGILIDRAYINDISHPLLAPGNPSVVGKFLIWKRPGLDNFLSFLFEYFNVAVWSSISKHNIVPTAKFIFGEHYDKLAFVYDRDFCEILTDVPSERSGPVRGDHTTPKPVVRKNLKTVWQSFTRFNETNTLIIDDSDEKMVNNPICSVFNPGTWKRGDTCDDALGMNGKIFKRLLEFGSAGILPCTYDKSRFTDAMKSFQGFEIQGSEEITKDRISEMHEQLRRENEQLRLQLERYEQQVAEEARLRRNEDQSRAQAEYHQRQRASVAERNINNYKRYGRYW
jgi:hypothetical protein